MFTNNFYKYHAANFCGTGSNSFTLEARDTSGTLRKIYYYNTSNDGAMLFGQASSIEMANYGIHFGDGTEPPTRDDYKLSGNKISGLTEVGRIRDVSNTSDTATLTENITVKNNNNETVTISEIAWIKDCYCDSRSASNFLFDRTLLENPVTIPSGEEGIIVYKRSVTIPTT